MVEQIDLIIEQELLEEIPAFENFFEAAGFKRIYGAIYGVLVLAPRALSSDEIEALLHISQSAVSQTVKVLLHFGIIEIEAGPVPRQKLYRAKENSLNIVSSIIRKREQQHIEEFKKMSERVSYKLQKHNINDMRLKRIESIEATCSIATALIEFIVHLGDERFGSRYIELGRRLPKILEAVVEGREVINTLSSSIAGKLRSSLKNIGGVK